MKLNSPLIIAGSFNRVIPLAQTMPKEELVFLTSEWKGERFADGRPKYI
jgi:hypothetical protein